MKIKKAEFITSNTDFKKCPPDNRPEYAFIGRSNVGKSSLINSLCNNKKLAKTSGTPGKTQLINHFNIDDTWYLVDLPGYGYAKTSKVMRSEFSKIITNYIFGRESLVNVFVLVDSRLETQKIDLDFMAFIGEKGIPFSIVFTKMDKLTKTQIEKNISAYRQKLLESWEELPPMFYTSAEKNTGTEEILDYIQTINTDLKNEQ